MVTSSDEQIYVHRYTDVDVDMIELDKGDEIYKIASAGLAVRSNLLIPDFFTYVI